MARLKEGFLGAFQGVLGTAEGYIRKGVPMIRAKKRKSKKKPTPLQLAQRQRMKVVNQFTRSMTKFLAAGFELIAENATCTANNAAKSYQMRNALQGEYPDISLDYSAAMVTKGTLPPALNPTAIAKENGVQFSWEHDPQSDFYNKRAQVMMLAYAPSEDKTNDQSLFSLSGARRTAGTDFLELPKNFKNRELHLYISMVGDDRKSISDSVYVGTITLS